jgi:putative aminopeptidase FrvX
MHNLNTQILKDLISIDSPSGMTTEAIAYIEKFFLKLGIKGKITQKGNFIVQTGKNPKIAFAIHVDTLGAMVSGIKKDGTLSFVKVGYPILPSFEASYVRVKTIDNKVYTGTLLLNNPSGHVNKEAESSIRTCDSMHIRLDEIVNSENDVRKLGIKVGDYICFETNYTETKSGFIKSRFIDNKAGCFIAMELANSWKSNPKPFPPFELVFSTNEEVGHGGAHGYSPSIETLIVIDMAVIGEGCTGDEFSCSICVKDSAGPYNFEVKKQLVACAEKNKIPYSLDVYPYYTSDGTVALRAGFDHRVGLIGPGVAASHGMERTHLKALTATLDLCKSYLLSLKKN